MGDFTVYFYLLALAHVFVLALIADYLRHIKNKMK
jgi:hypothetical protein